PLLSRGGFVLIGHRLPRTEPVLVALVGLAYGGVIGAAVTLVAFQADLLQYIGWWMNGEFSGVLQGRYELLWLAALVGLLSYFAADQFTVAGMGTTAAVSLGLNYRQTVLLGLVMVSLVTSLTVVTVGLIPFVGLVVPNIASRLFGDNLRGTLAMTAMLGACFVLACDIVGRLVRYPFEVPVSTVLGVVGACVFLWLLYRPARYAR
ncbi:MAG: iron chelate uptake ABC transporter family permease subunit, partial [Pseudomonadota bacterium]